MHSRETSPRRWPLLRLPLIFRDPRAGQLEGGADEAFGTFCSKQDEPVLGIYDVGCLTEAKKYGVVALKPSGEIANFEEKPAEPRSTLIGIALYYYPARSVAQFSDYLAAGNNPDQPGRFVQWLYEHTPVQTWEVPGTWFDVGSKETLDEANKIFVQFKK